MTESSVSFGFFQNVKLTRSRMNGHEFLVCASQFDGTSSCGVGSDGSEFKHINDSSGSDIFTALSLTSADDVGAWVYDRDVEDESWCCVCDGGTAYRGSVAGQSTDVEPRNGLVQRGVSQSTCQGLKSSSVMDAFLSSSTSDHCRSTGLWR